MENRGKDHRIPITIGVNVAVIRKGKILLGLRKNIPGDGTWGLPGGRMEANEGVMETALRELLEETGMEATRFKFVSVAFQRQEKATWIQFGLQAIGTKGEPENREPDCCGEWCWFALDTLPKNIFRPHTSHLQVLMGKGNELIEERFEV